ncbi:hypothetical protein [Mucilaginibacter paludis]|uniref:Uncharacterized protein n=1 Tax=Mucilaginibacter paludis DSM 18603 TaxID=714943 RepID=H1Y2Z2_9SPHI|nr:hypothetical protein [Mucilaginibacter paludis]EHQ28537.1 hypothetical protein Mucpa_4447 [Mucilaginibacter paludis DSM 18603]
MTIVVNPHSEQEEKVLLAFLNSLQYYYQANIDDMSLTSSQQQEVLRRDRDLCKVKQKSVHGMK